MAKKKNKKERRRSILVYFRRRRKFKQGAVSVRNNIPSLWNAEAMKQQPFLQFYASTYEEVANRCWSATTSSDCCNSKVATANILKISRLF